MMPSLRVSTVAPRRLALSALIVLFPALVSSGCRRNGLPVIAVIPRTSGTLLWDPVGHGAQVAAAELNVRIYWNASTREDDVDGQIALVERVTAGNYKGLVLAPNHALALLTPVRRALARGLVTVILSSPLAIPANDKLSFILNDEEEGGRIAAQRVAFLTGGHGSIAMIGIDPDIAGILARADSLEHALIKDHPGLQIVLRRAGSFNVAHEQQAAREVLKENPGLSVIVALTSTSTQGAISAIESDAENNRRKHLRGRAIAVIGFDPDSLAFESPALDSVVLQDTEGMGEQAIRSIHASLQGQPAPRLLELKPLLVTRENVSSKRVLEMTAQDWRPGSIHRVESTHP